MSYCSKINKDVTGTIEILDTSVIEHKLNDCEQNCDRYYQCDSIAHMQDELKFRQGECLKCPYCGRYQGFADCPDLFTSEDPVEQENLLREMQLKGYNIVTCGECGQPFIHRTEGD